MTDHRDTVTRILDGALRALAQQGRRKLSMRDVGAMSGMSRGTLYRYFGCKDEILDAIGAHVQVGLQHQLIAAIEERPDLNIRVMVVIESLVQFAQSHPEAVQMNFIEPKFGLDFVRAMFPDFVIFLDRLLAPALERTPAVLSGAMVSRDLSELILRVVATTFFVDIQLNEDLPRALAALPCLAIVAAI